MTLGDLLVFSLGIILWCVCLPCMTTVVVQLLPMKLYFQASF